MRLYSLLLSATLLLAAGTTGTTAQDQTDLPRYASRQNVLTGAKNLTLTTTKGTTYYYFISSEQTQMMQLSDSLHIGGDSFGFNEVKEMRFRSLARVVMNEDSTTYDKTLTMDHALLALRRDFQVGKWNSLVVPFDMTGLQVLDAFGEEAVLATVRGVREADETVVEFQTIDLNTSEVVLQANLHYLLRPTREADVVAGRSLYSFSTTAIPGPIYLIPNVSMKANQNARLQTFQNEAGTRKVRLRGTYLRLDDSVVSGRSIRNRRIAPGTYLLDEEGIMVLNEDSTIVGAFRSWVENLSEDGRPLKFYIDGIGEYLNVVATGIEELQDNGQWTMDNEIMDDGKPVVFDLSGRRMPEGRLPKGIYIVNGKKVAIKN